MASTTLLIIDGDDAFTGSVRARAEEHGYSVLTADTSTEGLDLARSHRPNIIVVSVELGPTNGWSVCTRLRKDEELQHTPIVLTSATSTPDTFEKHSRLKVRADEYLHKPCDPDHVLQVCEGLLGFHDAGQGEELVVEDESLSLGDFEGSGDDDSFAEEGDEPLDLLAGGATDDPLDGELLAPEDEIFEAAAEPSDFPSAGADEPSDAPHDPLGDSSVWTGALEEHLEGSEDPLEYLRGDDLELSDLEVLDQEASESELDDGNAFPDPGSPTGQGDDGFSALDALGGEVVDDSASESADSVDPLASVQGFEDLPFDSSPDSELSYAEESLSVEELSSLDAAFGDGDEADFGSGDFSDDDLASLEAEAQGDGAEFDGEDLQVFDEAFDQLSGGESDTADSSGDGGAFDPSELESSPNAGGEQDLPELLSMSDVSELSLGADSPKGDSSSFDDAGAFENAGSEAFGEEHGGADDWDGSAEAFGADTFGDGNEDPFAGETFEGGGFDGEAFEGDAFGSDDLGTDGQSADGFGGAFEGNGDFGGDGSAENEFGSEEFEVDGSDPAYPSEGGADPFDSLDAFGEESQQESGDASGFESRADGGEVRSGFGEPVAIAELEGRIAELEAELEGYRASESGRDQELERLNQELRARDAELLDSRNQQLEKDRIIHELRESESRLNVELARARDERVRREATVKALSAKAEQMAAQARRLEQEVTRSRETAEKLNALELESASLKERMAGIIAERDEANAGLAELESIRQECDSLRAALEEANARAEAAEARAAELEDKLSRARDSILGALG